MVYSCSSQTSWGNPKIWISADIVTSIGLDSNDSTLWLNTLPCYVTMLNMAQSCWRHDIFRIGEVFSTLNKTWVIRNKVLYLFRVGNETLWYYVFANKCAVKSSFSFWSLWVAGNPYFWCRKVLGFASGTPQKKPSCVDFPWGKSSNKIDVGTHPSDVIVYCLVFQNPIVILQYTKYLSHFVVMFTNSMAISYESHEKSWFSCWLNHRFLWFFETTRPPPFATFTKSFSAPGWNSDSAGASVDRQFQ